MGLGNYFIQPQDTTTKKQNNIIVAPNTDDNQLKVERQTIELTDINRLQVDSARMAKPKKVVPKIVKTVPFVPMNDSILHPSYNVFSGDFDLPSRPAQFSNFLFEPIAPELAQKAVVEKKQVQVASPNENVVLEKLQTEQLITPENKKEKKGFESTDWMLGVIIVSLLLFGWIRVGFGRFVNAVTQAGYNYFASRRLQEEGNIVRSRVFHFMNLLFFINIALFLTQILDYNNLTLFNLHGISVFFASLVFWIVLYGLKSFSLALLDFLFLTKGGFLSYNSTVFIYNKIYGFLLLPIVSVLPFVPSHITPIMFKIGIGMFGVFYVLRLFRGLQWGFKNRLSIFYMILYLCALEILPVLILYKLIALYL